MSAGCPLIVIGGSAGGIKTITRLLEQLNPNHECTIVAVLHRHRSSSAQVMTSTLQRSSRLPVVEIEDKMPIQTRHVYVAPADYHLLIEPGSFSLSIDEKVNYSRPSIDVALESAAESHGSDVIAVILTGANADGSKGATAVAEAGGRVVVQDPAEALAPEMPRATLAEVPEAECVPLEKMIEAIYTRRSPLVG